MGLGRGLGAILEDVEAGYLKDIPENGLKEINISEIELNPYQPRLEFNEDSIKELAESIKKYGLMQPIVVIKDDDKFILVSGERRLRAFKFLEREVIPAIVVDYSLNDLREYALIENIQREDLNPIEIAVSLKGLIEEHNYSHEELAHIIKKSRSYVSNMLRLLNLPDFVIEKLKSKRLSTGHTKILSGLDISTIKSVVDKIENENLTVRETEELIKKLKKRNYLDSKKVVKKFEEFGFKVSSSSNSIKILFKNEKDLEKLEKLLDKIN